MTALTTPQANVPLAPLSTLGVGGSADWFWTVSEPEDVARAARWCDSRGLPLLVLAGGSNLVIADAGFPGLVLKMAIRGHSHERRATDTWIRAGAGEPWDAIVADAVGRELAGMECLSGIPGSVGGTPIQNVGAYGQEVADTIVSVEVFDRRARASSTLTAAECGFSYRMSRFKQEPDRFIVCAVTFCVRPGNASASYPDIQAWLREHGEATPALADVRAAVLAVRRRKGMVVDADDPDSRSVGSFFMNPVVTRTVHDEVSALAGATAPGYAMADGSVKLPAAWLIEHAGFRKGFGDGPVGISSKHPLALVNRGGATTADVLRLAVTIKRQVKDRFGVGLRPEPVFAGFDHDPHLDFLQHE